ncbi:hypothetical protein FXO38_16975 [Capsicum annuum]|nr:hypothetical protein FXO38_16975 [Capsicum annuum]
MALPLRTLNIQLDVSPVDVVDPVTDEMLAKFFVDSHLKSQAKGATLDAKSFTDSRDTNRATIWPRLILRPVLGVYVVEKTGENENQNIKEEEQLGIFDDRLDDLDMNSPDDDQTPTPVDATNTMCSSSKSTQFGNLQDDGTGFFIGMSFKDKNELSTTLFISFLKKDFRIKKVTNSSSFFYFKCANSNCKWWLRAVKYASSDRFVIHKHEKHHTYGSEHISGQIPHATAKVPGEYFRSSFSDGKGPSTRVMANRLLTKLGVLVSYWKIYMTMGIAKDLVSGTLEHGYAVLDAYRYMIESTNPESFRHLRKGIVVDGTFLRSRYNGILLAAMAQDTENHIFPIAFCVADKECDASYGFF